MSKVTLNDITSGFASASAINANNTTIEEAFENTISRNGASPNHMNANLDMNGNMILNLANPITVSGFNWEGPWITATAYTVGDTVENSNSSYICIEAHTSGTFATDLSAGKWQVVASSASLPTQTGKAYYLLTTNGSVASWVESTSFMQGLLATASAADARSVIGAVSTTGDESISGVKTFTTPIAIASGGHGSTTAEGARTALGLSYGPSFGANSTTSQSLSSAVLTKVTIGGEEFDTDSNFSTNRFTPTVAGYYQINGMVNLIGFPLLVGYVAVYKNGVTEKRGSQLNAAAAANVDCFAPVISTIIYLNGSTDYVELYVYATGTTVSVTSAFMSGALIRKP